MQWTTILWIVIAIVAVFAMARGCGGMMGGMGCGMPRRRDEEDKQPQRPEGGKGSIAMAGRHF